MWKFPGKCGNSQENVEIFGRIQEKTSVFLENSRKMRKFPGKCGNFLRKSPSETVLINLNPHRRQCKSRVKPHRRRWNFKKFEFPAKNQLIFQRKSPSETVLVNLKVHRRRCLSIWKLIGDGETLKNVEIPRKMWKFSEKFRKKQVFSWKIPEKCGNSQENVEIF